MPSSSLLRRSSAARHFLNRRISSFPFLSVSPDLADAAPLPPKPSPSSPFYSENWRNPAASSILPVAVGTSRVTYGRPLTSEALTKEFAELMALQQWDNVKNMFEFWTRSLSSDGSLNRPDVHLYNQYLRANLMKKANAADLLDLVAQMQAYEIEPNTSSYNLVLTAMYNAQEHVAAEKLVERMLLTGILPDDETYRLIAGLLLESNQLDSAMKYLDLMLKSGYALSSLLMTRLVRSCVAAGRLEVLTSFIEKCKSNEHSSLLCPSWNLSYALADDALQADNPKLAFFALGFLFQWISRGENASPPTHLSLDEGLVIRALSTAGRTYNSLLLNAAWQILEKSLRKKRVASADAFLAKIYAYSSLGELPQAFRTLKELESAYGNSADDSSELFSPFTSLHPLVVACSKNGFSTLDMVYIQLENLSSGEQPFKSVAALNCVVLGCANIWDLNRAYETFEAIKGRFGLTPNIHSYNALLSAFGKQKKTAEASSVFDHVLSIGVKPNAATYSLLVDAHLVNRDPKSALAVIDKMVDAGFTPSKETLKKVRRRCSRELDFDSDDKVQSLAQSFKYQMGGEGRREMLYNLQYSTDY